MLQRIRRVWTYYRLIVPFVGRVGRADHAAAVEAGERILALEPRDFVVLVAMARAAAALGRVDAARQLWLRALEVEPGDLDARLQLAASFLEQGDHQRAYPHVKQALANAPALPRPVDRIAVGVERLIGLLRRQRGRAERYERRHRERQQALVAWLEWAATYVEWCESVLGLGAESVH